MRTIILIENIEVLFSWNWFTGCFIYSVDGVKGIIENVFDFDTHFSVRLSKNYEGIIGTTKVKIIKTRPLLFAGFRPHNYKFYVENKLIKELDSL
ncbi:MULTISPECIES: hypothetical protein [Chryseobacterium]|uniref:Uncharacterized protein n=1 Tax=Chryseobacterium taihuense TaxID=1141221 RepID=A0A4U8WF84_9FLAO|nr:MULTISPECIES: hypothetical protein [Chryseobacterium]QQV02709.1 hypothetical protein I6I61_16845 [Chryseobacterium sp. FDAARGOS 1104]VFB04030.1 Uncharacterised protein [Chryseobacterium taihuense]